MARKRSNRALGLDPLDDIADLMSEEAETGVEVEVEADVKLPGEVGPIETEPEPCQTMAHDEADIAIAATDTEVDLDELIAVIDREVKRAFDPERTPETVAATSMMVKDEEQHVLFDLAGAEYAVPIANVIEIGRPPDVTPVPNVPDWVLGVANLRGEVISMVDLRTFLGMDGTSYGQDSRMLVARASEENVTTGLIVDQVNGIRYLAVDRIVTPGALIEDRIAPYLRGVYEHDGRLLVVLNMERLLLSPEMHQFEMS